MSDYKLKSNTLWDKEFQNVDPKGQPLDISPYSITEKTQKVL